MMDRAEQAVLFTVLYGVPALLGIRATWRLWRTYLFDGESRRDPILLAFAVIATVITLAALWFGGLTLRRFLGFESLEHAAPVGIVIAAIIFLIPAALEWLVGYIASRPTPPNPIPPNPPSAAPGGPE